VRIGIIGGGINGLCCAWVLAQAGHEVDLYERNTLASQTSRASSKLLHGGLRYLEQYEFRLVREALKERDAWLQRVPELTSSLRLVLPIYQGSQRQRWLVGAGLFLYDHLAGKSILPPAQWLTAETLLQRDPQLKAEGLLGGYAFSDGQMDDHRLALWVADQARLAGATLREHMNVSAIDTQGHVHVAGDSYSHDRVINVGGPWAVTLLEQSGISSPYRLDTVRGSHLVLERERRIFFVLPWQGKTLVGTTEVRQQAHEPIECSIAERDYLLAAYNYYTTAPLSAANINSTFAGMRPLLYSAADPGKATREYALDRQGQLINVFGGKWTTSLALAHKVQQRLL
jgi:glycerol-3-phosphate dehydrogenase